jgi:hypothetical protein
MLYNLGLMRSARRVLQNASPIRNSEFGCELEALSAAHIFHSASPTNYEQTTMIDPTSCEDSITLQVLAQRRRIIYSMSFHVSRKATINGWLALHSSVISSVKSGENGLTEIAAT